MQKEEHSHLFNKIPNTTTLPFSGKYLVLLALVSLVLVISWLYSKKETETDFFVVSRGNITQSVSVSGSVEASKDAKLSFRSSGQVAFVGVKVGDRVEQGKVLASLEAEDVQASLLESQALLANRQATLDQLQQGSRPEELAIKEQAVNNAKNTLVQAYNSLPDVIRNTDSTISDAIKNKFSNLFTYNGAQAKLSFASCDQQAQGALEKKRTEFEGVFSDFQKKSGITSNLSSEELLDSTFSSASEVATLANGLVDGISQLLLIPCSVSDTSLNAYRASLSTVKANMNSLFTDLSSKKSALITAKNVFYQSSRDVELAKAGTNSYALKAQAALVSQAEAQLAQAKANLQKVSIRAPFTGVVSDVQLTEGEVIAPNAPVINLIAEGKYEIEAKVPEIDIVKIKVGDMVGVTLDSYGESVVFPATVSRINPTATTEGTVPVYKVIVTFVDDDTRIKQGMTANVTILTDEKTKALVVPSRFVMVVSGQQGKVIVLQDKKQEVRDVVLGVRGDKGLAEVISGIQEGETVVAPPTVSRVAQKQNN
jgi:HlyD family secretion protein